jgi:Glycosyl hydrolase family 20, domain 2
MRRKLLLVAIAASGVLPARAAIDLSNSTVVVRSGSLPAAEQTAAEVLTTEVAKRTGIHLPVATHAPAAGPVIALTGAGGPPHRPDGYRLSVKDGSQPLVSIDGSDARGVLYGVGQFLRRLEWGAGSRPGNKTPQNQRLSHYALHSPSLKLGTLCNA